MIDIPLPTTIDDSMQVSAWQALGLRDMTIDAGFDRFTVLAARLLRAPVSLISLVEPTRQFCLGAYGLAEPFASQREVPRSHSFCKHVVMDKAPLIVADARNDPRVANNLAISELRLIAYAGFPLRSDEGHVLGAFCVIDSVPRVWSAEDRQTMEALAAMITAHVSLCRRAVALQQAERFEAARRQCMEGLAAGWSLHKSLTALAEGLEQQFSHGCCAVMLLDRSSNRLHTGASPSLPEAYSAAIEGSLIGPEAGSCGTAAYLDQLVISEDTLRDPRWAPWAEVARRYGLRSCWSLPFHNSAGEVLGTFAVYHNRPSTPTHDDLALARAAAAVAALAVERWQTLEKLREREMALRQSQASLATLFDHASEAIWSVDRNYRLVQFNRVFQELSSGLGSRPPQRGLPLEEMVADDELRDWKACYDRAFTGELFSTELFQIVEQRETWFDVTFHPVLVEGEPVEVAVFARDITARKQQEEQRLHMERTWQETQRLESLGVFAGGIAHDFNNLLAAVQGNLGLALLDVPRDSEAFYRLSQAEQIVQHAAGLTQQLLAYSGKGQVTIAPLDLNQVVSELSDLVRAALPQPVPIVYRLAPNLPAIKADQAQIHQVVMNLLVNATEAIGDNEGSITLTTGSLHYEAGTNEHFIATELEPGKYVTLTVEDTGCGMDKPTLSRIFEPFFSTKFTGRGLGLAAVQGIIRSHKGSIQVESTPGVGTRICIALPVLDRPLDEARPPMQAFTPHTADRTILVIDDESQVRQIAVRMLERLGYRVLDAESSDEGVEVLGQCASVISCVLLDWTMPGQSGAATVRQIRERYPVLPIVVMSGYNAIEIDRQVGRPGIDGFLQKPFRMNELRLAMANAVQSRTMQVPA
jgi:PAS domain S-box-containing protein